MSITKAPEDGTILGSGSNKNKKRDGAAQPRASVPVGDPRAWERGELARRARCPVPWPMAVVYRGE